MATIVQKADMSVVVVVAGSNYSYFNGLPLFLLNALLINMIAPKRRLCRLYFFYYNISLYPLSDNHP